MPPQAPPPSPPGRSNQGTTAGPGASDAPAKPKANPLAAVGGLIGAAVGAVIGNYAAMFLLIPAGIGLVVGLIMAKVVDETRKPWVAAFAIQAGHLGWMCIAVVMVIQSNPQMVAILALDIVVLIGGLTWLLSLPGLGPVLLLGIYQLVGLGMNIYAISQAEFGSSPHKALSVHILLRAAALIAMIATLVAVKKKGRGFEVQGQG